MKKTIGVIAVILITLLPSSVMAAEKSKIYRLVLEQEITVTSTNTNVRTGPGTEYQKIGTVKKNEILQVLGAIGNWYVICLEDGSIGVISKENTKVLKLANIYPIEGSSDEGYSYQIESDDTEEDTLFSLTNNIRIDNELKPFAWDEKLNKIAELKAQDMVDNEYFGHNSKDYGTPFQMLKKFEVMYISASENIATSISVESGHANMINVPSQRQNILNNQFNKMGVGVVDSSDLGKVIVQIFVEE